MVRRSEKTLPLVVDSREQLPYEFAGATVKALPSGDYSLDGMEHRVAIERKTLADAYGSLGRGRRRFEREMERLSKLDFAAVVIEATLEEFLRGAAYSQLNPKSAINSLIAWTVRFRIPVFFAGNRRYARSLTYRLLEKFLKYAKEKPNGG
jgi:DNA excision repair protein ERCC-4